MSTTNTPPTPQPRRARGGFTMLEVLVATAMVGILASIGYVSLPRDRFAAREAARVLAADLNRARSEAVRLNANVALRFGGGGGCGDYCLYLDDDRDGAPDADLAGFELSTAMLQRRTLAGDFPRATMAASGFGAANTVWFDVRGLPRASSGGYLGATATATVRPRGGEAGFLVTLEPQGRVQVTAE